ncbi:hypothetical protein CDEST_00325 [Colletotrichum destructivum]|uniref:Uncharacterized protein n=1 Tax=Colletotrichum destructivum TaxID=34406 RepID=A0AAX4HWS4_9PEZI|nr:hypothetical protein CDEST_00325 [Colletotrichum destructivum]
MRSGRRTLGKANRGRSSPSPDALRHSGSVRREQVEQSVRGPSERFTRISAEVWQARALYFMAKISREAPFRGSLKP